MGIIKNNKNIIAIYRGDKKITSVFKNNLKIFGESEPPIEVSPYAIYETTEPNQSIQIVGNPSLFKYIRIVETGEELDNSGTTQINYTFENIGEHKIELEFKQGLDNIADAFNQIMSSGISYKASYCTNLKYVSNNLLKNCETVTSLVKEVGSFLKKTRITLFGSCSMLKTIPEGLFDTLIKVTGFDYTFQNCTSLQTIPSGLFSNNTNVTNFYYTFQNCTSLQTIPNGLFDKNTQVTGFYYTFQNCTSLQTIPNGLFDKNTQVTGFYYTFQNCTSLQTIPSGLFDTCTQVTLFNSTFSNCTSLQTIPNGLFDTCVVLSNCISTFSGCTELTEIPLYLFKYNKKIIFFNYAFKNCINLTSNCPIDNDETPIYNRSENGKEGYEIVENAISCFENCTKMQDYSSIPSGWKS